MPRPPFVALLVSAPITGYLSDHVLARRRLPYLALSWGSVGLWAVFALTLGALPLWGVYGLFFAMGLSGAAFVLTAALLAFLIRESRCRNIYHELFPAGPPFVGSSSDSR